MAAPFFSTKSARYRPHFRPTLTRPQEGEFERVGGQQTLKINFRLVCATNRNLEEFVAEGKFRADLYYRINVVPLLLPPLRERAGDIPALAMHFLNNSGKKTATSSLSAPTLSMSCGSVISLGIFASLKIASGAPQP